MRTNQNACITELIIYTTHAKLYSQVLDACPGDKSNDCGNKCYPQPHNYDDEVGLLCQNGLCRPFARWAAFSTLFIEDQGRVTYAFIYKLSKADISVLSLKAFIIMT